MQEQVKQIKENALQEMQTVNSLQELDAVRVKYLGKKGELTSILRGMGGLSPEERPIIGNAVNKVKEEVESLIAEKEEKLQLEALNKKLEEETIDITLPSTKIARGSKHPINRVIEEIEDLFVSMGYDVEVGP